MTSELPLPPKPKRCWRKGSPLVPTKWYIRWLHKCRLVKAHNDRLRLALLMEKGRVRWDIS